ncbi:MAG: NfeD family protein [Kiritimatiellia bacterium]
MCAQLFVPVGILPASAAEDTYVIPVKGTIERGLVYVVRRGVTEAAEHDAGAVIFDMDTPGGRLDAAKEIVEEILRILRDVDIPTYTYVNPEAISAGAVIALATDHIYMAPGSSIGAATPLMASPMGGVQEMPDAVEEKMTSYVDSLIRRAAETSGHDTELASAMVRREIEYKIGDEVISPKGRLLTMTNKEAERMVQRDGKEEPLLSEGTVNSLDELLETIGRSKVRVKRLEITWSEKAARWIEVMSFLFLMGGLAGLYAEMKTPGFGVPGILGLLFLAVFFWGHNIAGLAGMEELLIFFAGVALLAVEIFLIPGFGAAGISGIVLMTVALGMAMVEHYPGGEWHSISGEQIQRAVFHLGLSFAGSMVLMILLARFLPRTHIFQRLMLSSATRTEDGYSASDSTEDLVGLEGKAQTPLRPSGIGIFGDRRLNVVARGDFVEKDTPVVIAETHGNRIVVERREV